MQKKKKLHTFKVISIDILILAHRLPQRPLTLQKTLIQCHFIKPQISLKTVSILKRFQKLNIQTSSEISNFFSQY